MSLLSLFLFLDGIGVMFVFLSGAKIRINNEETKCFCDLTIFKEVEKVIGQKMSIFASRN